MKINKLKFILPILGVGIISSSIVIATTSCSSNKNSSSSENIINKENLQSNFSKITTNDLQDLTSGIQQQDGKLELEKAKTFLTSTNALSEQDVAKVVDVFLTLENISKLETNFQTLKFTLKVVFNDNKTETISNIDSGIGIINFNQTNFVNSLNALNESELNALKNGNIDELKAKIVSFNCGFSNVNQIQTVNISEKISNKQTKENTSFNLTSSIEVTNKNVIYINKQYKSNITFDFTINVDVTPTTQTINLTESDINSIKELFNSAYSYENVFNISSQEEFNTNVLGLFTNTNSLTSIVDNTSFKNAIESVQFTRTSTSENEETGYIKGTLTFIAKNGYVFSFNNSQNAILNISEFVTGIYNPNSNYNTNLFTTTTTSDGQYKIATTTSTNAKIYIPSNINGNEIIGIGDNTNGMFLQQNTEVVLPPTIDRIASYAFKDSYISKIVCLSNKENFTIYNSIFTNIHSTSITIDLSYSDNISNSTLSNNVFTGLPTNIPFTFIVKTEEIKTTLEQRINSLSNHPTEFTINVAK